jgi:N-acetylmuramoyl-L-alanine amidase
MALRKGDKGDSVKELQKLLKSKGIYKGDINGDFDKEIYDIVVKFQKELNLDADGIVGQITLNTLKNVQRLEYLIIHCADTPEGKFFDGDDIISWHTMPAPKGRGWSKPGYSNVILLDGTIESLQKYDDDAWVESNEITNGAAGINSKSRHICYIGGKSADGKSVKDTRTIAQKKSLEKFVKDAIVKWPDIKVAGHYHFSTKSCPAFNTETWLKEIGVNDNNIYKKGN